MSDGSANVLITGTGKNQIWKDVTVKGGISGSQILTDVGETYGGLGSPSDTSAIGSIFRVLGSIFFVGAGTLYYKGADTGGDATTTLSIKTINSGLLSATYQAGLAEPSAPTIEAIAAPNGFSGDNNGVVSVQIARVRSDTGGVSNASPTSNVVSTSNQSVAITFPSADANGQDYWAIYATKNKFGGIGAHLFLTEIAESVIAETVTATATLDADTTISVPNGTLTSSNIGWQYTSSGDTTTYVTAVGADDSASSGFQQITLNAASVLNTSQSVTFTRAVNGTTRTYVVEWKDTDLDAELAPIRNFPPPPAIFGGVSGDVVFVDGVYGDSANVASRTDAQSGVDYDPDNVGNAIAVSDPAKPESFPPDNYIFTGDAPTCIIPGAMGVHWRFGNNSLGVIRYVGGSPALTYEQVWTGVGVQHQHNAVTGQGGRLYAYTAKRGLVRLGQNGEPDTLFAADVADDMEGWNPTDTVLGFDGDNQHLCVMNGTTILAYYEPVGAWCAPCTVTGVTGTIKGAVTVNGSMYLAIGDSSTISLYGYNDGSGSTGTVVTPWIDSDMVADVIAQIQVSLRADSTGNQATVEVFTNGANSTAKRSQAVNPIQTGFSHLPVLKPNVTNAKSFRVKVSLASNGGDSGFDKIIVNGESSAITF